MSMSNHAEMTDQEFEYILSRESHLFEDELNGTDAPQDPKERARLRHLHYTKQSEKQMERMRALGTLAKKKEREHVSGSTLNRMKKKTTVEYLHNREFEAQGTQKTYRGPLITPADATLLDEQNRIIHFLEQQESVKQFVNKWDGEEQQDMGIVEQQYPAYLGEDGTLYDKHYMPVMRQDPEYLQARGKFSIVQRETIGQLDNEQKSEQDVWYEFQYCHDPELYQTCPNPYSYETFDEYEQAMLRYSADVQNRLGYLQLPVIMGRHYYRPYVHNIDKEDDPTNKLKKSATIKRSVMGSGSESSYGALLDMDDTWEAQLVPMEPKPEFYDTFEEYEKAMQRWCIACMGLPLLPPHPAQFQKLLGLRIVDPPTHPIADVEVTTTSSKKKDEDEEEEIEVEKTTNARGHARGKGRKKRRRRLSDADHVYRDNEDHLLYKGSDGWSQLSQPNRDSVMKAVARVHAQHFEIFIKHGVFHIQVVPQIHGVFTAGNDKLMRRLSLSNVKMTTGEKKKNPTTVREWISHQRQQKSLSSVVTKNISMAFFDATADGLKHQIALRRTDMGDDLKAAHDCADVEQEREVTFKIPEFDIGQIRLAALKDQSYVRFLQILLTRMDYGTRYNKFNSWYYPTIPQKVHDDNIIELTTIFDKIIHPTQIDKKVLNRLFQTGAFLDTFAEFLDRYMKQVCYVSGDKPLSIFHELLFFATTLDNFKHILSFFSGNSSTLVHAKVAFYISAFLKTDKARAVLEQVIANMDLTSMYYIATAVTFYDEVPINIFQYSREMQELVKIKYGDQVNQFLTQLSLIYLMNCTSVSLLEEDSEFKHTYPLLIQKLDEYRKNVNTFLKENPEFLQKSLWSMLGSRSKQFSALGRFVLSFLFLLSFDPELHHLLKSTTDLVNNVRVLSVSKLSHVQDAVTRIFPTLQEGQKWRMLLTEFYSHKENVVKDVVKSAERTELDSQPPLISSLVIAFLEEALTVKHIDLDVEHEEDLSVDERARLTREALEKEDTYQMIQGLLKEEAFHAVLQEVLATSRERRMHQGTIQGTMFLAKFAKYMICNNLIVGDDEKKKSSTGGGMWSILKKKNQKKNAADVDEDKSPKLVITPTDINQMLEFVCNENTRNRRAYRPRMFMLETLRHLLKCPTVFELVNPDKNFFERIRDICEDGMDMQFNRNAWRLFYQLIKFHTNTMELLIKFNVMPQFLDLIGSKIGKSSTVTTNSIHYFNKIFQLPENTLAVNDDEDEDEHSEKTVNPTKSGYNVPSPAVREKYATTVKALSDYIISKQLYNLFHFVYTKLITDYQGWPFQAMAQLYHTLDSHSSTANLAKAFKKQKEYATGLQQISDMHSGVGEPLGRIN
jgi:hypothetical protein